jgi:predicted nucleotidyltransferase
VDVEKRLKEKRDAVMLLAAKHGARNIRVFGSVARGEPGPESDVDLLVRWKKDGVCWI